ncbi:hypothetical protein PanWU01x14_129330, partial [Parasponia andersonii]
YGRPGPTRPSLFGPEEKFGSGRVGPTCKVFLKVQSGPTARKAKVPGRAGPC